MGLTYSSVVDASVDEVFAWHARPGAITRLAPPWLPVRVIREARVQSLRDGRAVLGLPGGLRWVAAHQPDGYDPPYAFADSLESLPLSAVLPWRHTHEFSPAGEHGHAGDRRGRHPAARPGAPVHVRLPAPAARRLTWPRWPGLARSARTP